MSVPEMAIACHNSADVVVTRDVLGLPVLYRIQASRVLLTMGNSLAGLQHRQRCCYLWKLKVLDPL